MMTLIADAFPKLRSPKILVKQMSQKSRDHLTSNGKADQTLLRSERQKLYHIYWSLSGQLSWKKSILVICKVLTMFINKLTPDDKCFLLNVDNLRQPVHIQLSGKTKQFLKVFLKLRWKKSLLVICKILGLFVNILNDSHKYSLLNRENLKEPIQLQLSQKQNIFSQFVAAFLKCRLNLEHLQKRDDPHSWCISEITDSKKRV